MKFYPSALRVGQFEELGMSTDKRETHLDLFPILVVHLQTAHVMLNGHNEAVTRYQLLCQSTAHVYSSTEGDNSREGIALFLVAEWTGIQGLLGPGKVCILSFLFYMIKHWLGKAHH